MRYNLLTLQLLYEGYSAERILEETCPEVSLEMCVLKAGHTRNFEVYSHFDRMQIFAFTVSVLPSS